MVVLSQKRSNGMTLIEVLIALAICAIAVSAIIKATSQNIRGTNYLKEKSIAMWLGENLMNQARMGSIAFPKPPGEKGEREFLGQKWYYLGSQSDTPNAKIKKINVKIFSKPIEDEEQSSVISFESYVYHG